MANDRPNLKQIRIKRSVCARLDERKDKDDSYTDVIKALLDENDRLLERTIELERDKERFNRFLEKVTYKVSIEDEKEKAQAITKLKELGFDVEE